MAHLDPINENLLCKRLNQIETYSLAVGMAILKGLTTDEIDQKLRELEASILTVRQAFTTATTPISPLLCKLGELLGDKLYYHLFMRLGELVTEDETWCYAEENKKATAAQCREVMNRQREIHGFLKAFPDGVLDDILSEKLVDFTDRSDELVDLLSWAVDKNKRRKLKAAIVEAKGE